MIRKIRKSKLQIEYALFWVAFSALLIILSLFPQITYWLASVFDIQSPVNLVFLIIIFVLIVKNFMLTIEISNIENRLKEFVQEMALKDKGVKKSDNCFEK